MLTTLLLALALGLVVLLDETGNAASRAHRENAALPACSRVAIGIPPAGVLESPFRGLSEAEMAQRRNQARFEFAKRYEAWLVEVNELGFDTRDLPRESFGDYIGQELRDLRAAVKDADVIVTGRAIEVTWRPGHGVLIFEIDSRLKGGHYVTAQSIPLLMPGGPYPKPDFCFNTAQLIDHPPTPLLFPGERAVLFLEMQPTGTLDVQPYSGHYLVERGRIKAVADNNFRDEVDGLTLDAFVRLIRSHLD